MSLAVVTRPRLKYLAEGDDGTIAACFESSLIPVFRSDIRWYHILNATTKIQIPSSNAHSEVWYTGYVLKATSVQPQNSGNYCCTVGEIETCIENATTQLVVAVTPQLIIHEPMVTTTYGESAQLTCSHANPNASPIRMQWYKSDTLLFTGGKYTISSVTQHNHSYTLQIHNVSEGDEGTYKCIADSPHSSAAVETIHLTGIVTT